jgi:hypothetical protein
VEPSATERLRDLAQPLLEPGEAVLHLGHAVVAPWWTRLAGMGALFRRHYALVATERRLLLVEQGLALGRKQWRSVAWPKLQPLELRRGMLARTLVLEAPAQRLCLHFEVPRLSQPGNFAAVEGVLAQWSAHRRAPQEAVG